MTDKTPAMPEHTIGKHDHPEPHTMCWSDLELAAIKRYAEAYALAALQSAQPAEVSDAEVDNIIEQVGQAVGFSPLGWDCADPREIVRAILALRPQAVPMTEDEFVACLVKANCIGVVKMSYDSGPYYVTRPSINASKLKEAVEAHHGITAPAGGEG